MNRRDLLVAAGAFAAAPVARAEVSPPDPFGLRAILGSSRERYDPLQSLEQALSALGEKPILRQQDEVQRATFRLTRILYSSPATARLEWDPVTLRASAEVSVARSLREGAVEGRSEHVITFLHSEGIRLRALVDDLERFWDAAPRTTDWNLLDGVVTISHASYLLEGRVGQKRHAILRRGGADQSLVRRLEEEVLPKEAPAA